MAIPEGYSFLAKIGVAYKGDYNERTTYNQYDAVYYDGSTYIALVDSPAGPPSADGSNWQYMAKGFVGQIISNLSSLNATDKNGVIGEAGSTVNAQNLVDGMSDEIKDKLDKTGDSSDTIVAFEPASSRENIVSGEKSSTFFGKIMKWFADLKAAAFAEMISSYSDLMANTVSGYLVDALAVKEGLDAVNSKFANNNIDNYVSLKGYTIDNPYIFPSDGYVESYASVNSSIYAKLIGSSGGGSIDLYSAGTSAYGNTVVTFVRKGMMCYETSSSGTAILRFFKVY